MNKVTIFWFRRDLRLEDNAGLYHALQSEFPVQPVFIFDSNILEKLADKTDRRVAFIYRELQRLNNELRDRGASLDLRVGSPFEVWQKLLEDYDIGGVYANRDYEPYARERDKKIYNLLNDHGVEFFVKKDQVIFDHNEVLKDDGTPYTVYTPFSKRWKSLLTAKHLESYPSEHLNNWNRGSGSDLPGLETIGFIDTNVRYPERMVDLEIIRDYHQTRDFPGGQGTTRLSVHLRFGTISIRSLTRIASEENVNYFNELIWREFLSNDPMALSASRET